MPTFKSLISLAFCFTFCACLNKNVSNNDWQKDNIKGNVKAIKTIAYLASEKFGNIQIGDREIKSIANPDYLIEYDKDGRKVKEVNFYSFNTKRICNYQYLENDKQSLLLFYNNFGELYCKWIYKLDDDNLPIEMIRYDSLGEVIEKEIFYYDQNKKLSEELNFDNNGDLQIRIFYKYNDEGYLIKLSQLDSDSSSMGDWKYNYNDNGDVIDEWMYNNVGLFNSHWTYKYKHDNNSNWIEKTYYLNGKVIKVEEREIEYY